MKTKDKDNFIKSILQVATPCDCICHKKGTVIRHIMPCCNRTYEKFKD